MKTFISAVAVTAMVMVVADVRMKPRGRWRPMTPTPRGGCIPSKTSRRVAERRSALPCDN